MPMKQMNGANISHSMTMVSCRKVSDNFEGDSTPNCSVDDDDEEPLSQYRYKAEALVSTTTSAGEDHIRWPFHDQLLITDQPLISASTLRASAAANHSSTSTEKHTSHRPKKCFMKKQKRPAIISKLKLAAAKKGYPLVRVIQMSPPTMVTTRPEDFRSVVQKLTGSSPLYSSSSSTSVLPAYCKDSPPHDQTYGAATILANYLAEISSSTDPLNINISDQRPTLQYDQLNNTKASIPDDHEGDDGIIDIVDDDVDDIVELNVNSRAAQGSNNKGIGDENDDHIRGAHDASMELIRLRSISETGVVLDGAPAPAGVAAHLHHDMRGRSISAADHHDIMSTCVDTPSTLSTTSSSSHSFSSIGACLSELADGFISSSCAADPFEAQSTAISRLSKYPYSECKCRSSILHEYDPPQVAAGSCSSTQYSASCHDAKSSCICSGWELDAIEDFFDAMEGFHDDPTAPDRPAAAATGATYNNYSVNNNLQAGCWLDNIDPINNLSLLPPPPKYWHRHRSPLIFS